MTRREELYNLFRKAHPRGNEKMQRDFSNDIAEDRVEVYIEIFRESGKN
jgi:hypothetical protein